MSEIIKKDLSEIIAGMGDDVRKLEGKTILISGGAGFLGSYIVALINELNRQKLSKKCSIISLDNYISGKKNRLSGLNIDKNFIKLIKADVTKPIKINKKIDYIIHAAGIASPIYYQKYPVETIESAIFGAKYLLELSREKKVKSFLFFSSSEIYGDPDNKHLPTSEDYKGNVSSTGPRSAYDESKRLGESLSMVYYRRFKVPVKMVRPFNVYGPGMYPDDFRVIPSFISSALSHKTIIVHNKGIQTRTFCYITDAVTFFLKILLSEKNGQVYNVGSHEKEITILQLAQRIRKFFKYNIPIKQITYPNTYPQDEPKRRLPNISKIIKETGYSPKINLEIGLKRMIKWYIDENII